MKMVVYVRCTPLNSNVGPLTLPLVFPDHKSCILDNGSKNLRRILENNPSPRLNNILLVNSHSIDKK